MDYILLIINSSDKYMRLDHFHCSCPVASSCLHHIVHSTIYPSHVSHQVLKVRQRKVSRLCNLVDTRYDMCKYIRNSQSSKFVWQGGHWVDD